MADEIPWVLELDREGQPNLAHRIVDYDAGRAACGRTFDTTSLYLGWWTTTPGQLPLQPEFIHCGSAASTAR